MNFTQQLLKHESYYAKKENFGKSDTVINGNIVIRKAASQSYRCLIYLGSELHKYAYRPQTTKKVNKKDLLFRM